MIPQIMPKGETPQVSGKSFEIPNESLQGAKTVGSTSPLGHALDVVTVPNDKLRDSVGSTANLSKSASPVKPPNHRFSPDGAKMAQPQSAVGWHKGSVPVRAGGTAAGIYKRAK